MRFPDGPLQTVPNDRTERRLRDHRGQYRASRAIQPQARYFFFWQALSLTIVFVIAAAMMGAAHGAEGVSASRDRLSSLVIDKQGGSSASGQAYGEVSHAGTI
jgi:hypothetical protein